VDIRLLGFGGNDSFSLVVDVPQNSPVALSLAIDGGDGIDSCLAPPNSKSSTARTLRWASD